MTPQYGSWSTSPDLARIPMVLVTIEGSMPERVAISRIRTDRYVPERDMRYPVFFPRDFQPAYLLPAAETERLLPDTNFEL